MKDLPKNLLGFYVKYAFKPFAGILIIWTMIFIVERIASVICWPLIQTAFIALFENPLLSADNMWAFILPTMIVIFVSLLLIELAYIVADVLYSHWQPKINNKLSEILNDYIHNQSMGFWTNRMSGKINSQINYVAGGFSLFKECTNVFALLILIMLNAGLMLTINKWIALLMGCFFMFRLTYGILFIKPMNKMAKVASESSSSLSGKLIDSLSNFSIVKLFSGAASENKYAKPAREKVVNDRIKSSFIQRLSWSIPNIVWSILFGVTLVLCAYLYVAGQMKVSEIVFAMSSYFSVMGAIEGLTYRIPSIVDVIGSAQQSYRELVKPIEIVDIENAPELIIKNGSIEIKNLTFKYGRKKVLDNLSLSIKSGEKVGLVGSSGAGKTTLVNLLMRFYDPAKGEILFDGTDIKLVTQDSLRKNITFIPQEPALFNRSLFDNIAYGKEDASLAEVRRAARHAAADKFIMEAPKKYDSMVGDRGIKLSGGQKQRVAIARAFLKNAPVLILDEATSALDSETESVIQESFRELSRGRTTIAIAHRLSTLRNMDRIVVMDAGKIVESGTHNALLRRRGGIYARLWKMQSGGFIQE